MQYKSRNYVIKNYQKLIIDKKLACPEGYNSWCTVVPSICQSFVFDLSVLFADETSLYINNKN